MTRLRALALVLLAAAWLAFALLAVVRAPTNAAWQLSILATEFGHLLAPIGLLFLLGRRRSRAARAAAVAGWLGSLLLLTPLLRAVPVLREVAAQDPPGADFEYRLIPGAIEPVTPRRMVYAERDSLELVLDFYAPADARAPAPLVVVIHGGSWSAGDPTQLAPLNSILARQGYAVAAISYRLAPRHPHPAQVDDVRTALAWLRLHAAQLGIDAERIVLLGRSAGGHLALLAAFSTPDSTTRGVISFYAPTDLIWGWDHPASPRVIDSRAVLSRFIGGTPADSRAAFVDASPIAHATGTPPVLLMHGTRDELVSVEHYHRLGDALRDAGRDVRSIEMPWATHGCDYAPRGPCGNLTTRAVLQFLARVAPLESGRQDPS